MTTVWSKEVTFSREHDVNGRNSYSTDYPFIQMSPENDLIAISHARSIDLIETSSGNIIRTVPFENNFIVDVDFVSLNKKLLITLDHAFENGSPQTIIASIP